MLENCPGVGDFPANDTVFKATQRAGFPCRYHHDGDFWQVWIGLWYPPPAQGSLYLQDINGITYFQTNFAVCPDEGIVLANDIAGCGGPIGAKNGIGIITWRLETLKVMDLLNIKVQNDLFMEMRPLSTGGRVYKYCKVKQPTNVKILYDP